MRAKLDHMPSPIVFLVPTRAFVLFYGVSVVLVQRIGSGDAGLDMPAHPQPVDVQAGAIFGNERCPSLQRDKVLGRLCVNGVRIRIRVRRQIDLGA